MRRSSAKKNCHAFVAKLVAIIKKGGKVLVAVFSTAPDRAMAASSFAASFCNLAPSASSSAHNASAPVSGPSSAQEAATNVSMSPVYHASSIGKRHNVGKGGFRGKGGKFNRPGSGKISTFSIESFRRTARRAGCKRIAKTFLLECDAYATHIVNLAMSSATLYTEHRRCKTVVASDMFHALKRHGVLMYGGEEKNTQCPQNLMPKKKK